MDKDLLFILTVDVVVWVPTFLLSWLCIPWGRTPPVATLMFAFSLANVAVVIANMIGTLVTLSRTR